jgi:hypothetical protein
MMKKYPQWVNNLVYFLAGISFGQIIFYLIDHV